MERGDRGWGPPTRPRVLLRCRESLALDPFLSSPNSPYLITERTAGNALRKRAEEGRVRGEHREEEVLQRNGLNPTGEPRATPKKIARGRKRCPDGSRAGQQGWLQR